MQLLRLYHTIRQMRGRQVWYRVIRPIQRRRVVDIKVPESAIQYALGIEQQPLFCYEPFDKYDPQSAGFSILNIEEHYPDGIDWNDKRNGLLWCYHLNYFGWLEDERISVSAGGSTIEDYVANRDNIRVGFAPYPTSLRSIAWIRFAVKHRISREAAGLLFQHLYKLYKYPEYELDGNHLWENGCALLAGGIYFNHSPFYDKGIEILTNTFEDQLGADGGHLEGSPMYHSLLLMRLMICIELMGKLTTKHDRDRLELMKQAAIMLGWMERFTFSNGEWPMVNDCAPGVAPSTETLMQYAKALSITPETPKQNEGYRLFKGGWYELFLDVGNIGPSWQPGHAHADSLSFCLTVDGDPVIVDTGISTYNVNERRYWERSTAAHNTVIVNGMSSSDVWKSFRVGRRARVTILEESTAKIRVSHDGYRFIGVKHERIITFGADKITIEDFLEGLDKQTASLHLYFHPNVNLTTVANNALVAKGVRIVIDGAFNIVAEPYEAPNGFNRLVPAQRLRIETRGTIKTTIERTKPNAD